MVSQFGVFGPIPLGVLIVGRRRWRSLRRRLAPGDLMLLCFTLPPLVIVTAQAFISRANANWSGAGYLPGAILVAAWLVRWRARRWLIGGAGASRRAVAAFFLVVVISPRARRQGGPRQRLQARPRLGADDRRDRWTAPAREPGLTAIAVNNRFLFYALAYYGRDDWATGAPPLASWLLMDGPAATRPRRPRR